MSKTNNNKSSDLGPEVRGPGELLRRTRLQSGLSVEEVCRYIGITSYTLEALESDNFKVLPAPVFVRGYLRAYCSLLKLRPSPVIACYDDYRQHLAQLETPPAPPQKRRFRGVTASLGVSMMACSLVTWALYADVRGAQGDVSMETLVPPVVHQGYATQDEPAAPGALDMRFHGDSWLQVIDANDHILAVDLFRAGTHLRLEGAPPFKITLGHAPGVEISYQGAVVEVIPDPETLAADITVGR